MSRHNTHLKHIGRLATRDLLHQKLASLVLVLALAAVLTPLLVLFGLKFGVIDNLLQSLIEDPHNREIRLVGHGRFDRDWFERMRQQKGVTFVIPRTRGAAATIELRPNLAGASNSVVELIPTAEGDPLLMGHATAPQNVNEMVLSGRTARQLGAREGDQIKGNIRRKQQGKWSREQIQLKVTGIVPDAVFNRQGAFVTPKLLTAIEDFRDGYAVTGLGWGDGEAFTGKRVYSGFRLFVDDLQDVAPIRDLLMNQGQGFEVLTQAKAIEEVKLFDRYLTSTYLMIAFIGVAGYLLSFGASMWVNVERKRRELSVLQLLGFPSSAILFFPIIQSALIALCGALLASLMFGLISLLINVYFASESGQFEGLCRLLPSHLLISLFATLLCAVTASALAAWRTTRIEPAEGLREL